MNEFYSEISNVEYREMVFENKLLSISMKEHQTLVDDLNIDLRLHTSGRYGITIDTTSKQSRKVTSYLSGGESLRTELMIIISKLPDEWFAVRTEEYTPHHILRNFISVINSKGYLNSSLIKWELYMSHI